MHVDQLLRACGLMQPVDVLRHGEDATAMLLFQSRQCVMGGISTGQPIVLRIAFKPTPSIAMALRSVGSDGMDRDVRTKGRHDPCVGIRGVAVAESMMALVLADHKLLDRAICGVARQ
jgi:chorismate synthase